MSARQSRSNRNEIEALAYVIDALRQQEMRYRRACVPVPASVPQLLEDISFRVTRGQGGSWDAATAPDQHAGLGLKLVAVRYETAARMLEVSVSTIKRLIRAGDLPSVHVGGAARIRVADLEAYVAAVGSDESDEVA